LIMMKLKNRMKTDKEVKEKIVEAERNLIFQAIEAIQDRFKFRNSIRRFESYFGLRGKLQTYY
ncbi:hypothetical protein, partial [Escherichia coli]|uniref:hypothetical protein n=1 Tax=Escherichia coli TaxID=562 RepID=UPI001AA15B0B